MFDMNNKSNWARVLSHLKTRVGGLDKSEAYSSLSDSAFVKKVVKTIEDASCQYSSLTGARYKGPDFDRIYQEDKLRLQRTEQLIEKLLKERPLAYELSVFEKWSSDNKLNILLRAQSSRSTPLFVGNQNVFHCITAHSGKYWLGEWYKNRKFMPDATAAYWLNQCSAEGKTPLQLLWVETLQHLRFKKNYKGVLADGENFDDISLATILVLESDWGVLDPNNPKSIAQQWGIVVSDTEFHGVFPAIEAAISKKNLNNAVKEVVAEAPQLPLPRKI